MPRRFQFSLRTFFWPTVVVVAYMALAVLTGLVSGQSEPSPGVEVSSPPYELNRDLAIVSLITLAGLFFGTWLIVLLVGRLSRK